MKYLPCIFGGLLGAMFIFSGVMGINYLSQPLPPPAGPELTLADHFTAAFFPSGYMHFVKICEILGGILLAIPKTRNFGLLVLGPILLNIIAYHVFVMKGEGLFKPPVIPIMGVVALYLLWVGRKQFAGLCNCRSNSN